MPETVSFEHYEVLTRDDGSLYELGRGAMGVTYKAFDSRLQVPVALKVINATYLHSEVARERFVREAQSAAKLRHRNVATVYHLGTEDGAWFYAMEFIDGETVDTFVKRRGPLDVTVALAIAAQVARALNAAVPHGLVHRDLKPANLMLVREDDDLVVKVIDFGLALSTAAGDDEEHAGFVGTPHFASPEQLREEEGIDVRSDIYSLGVTLWFMLAGRTPFTGSMEEVKREHLETPPPFEQLATLPPPALALLTRMLEKDAARRQQSPQELRRAIEECLEQIDGSAAPDEEGIAAVLEDAQERAGETQFEPRAVIAGRYRIVEALGETNAGRVFRCHDRERQRDVRMLVLAPELIADAAAATQIEREVEKIAAVHHENLLQLLGLESIDGATFLTMEWTEGFSALELLRVRRELEADETLLLLRHAAAGADAALAAGLRRVDFALHQVVIHFAQAIDKEKLMRTPLLMWPPFTAKLNPLGITRELSASETWGGAQTMVQGVAAGEGTDIRARYVHALGAIAYELLGGTLNPLVAQSGAGHYTPLATLSEEGNEVLKRALDPARSFASAGEFYDALRGIEVLELKRPATQPPPTGVARPGSQMAPRSRPGRTTVGPRAKKKRVPVKFFGSLLTVLFAGAGVYLLSPRDGKRATDPVAEDSGETPAVTPSVEDMPVVEEPKTPDPVKMRLDALRAAIERADATEREGDPEKSIAAWLAVARDFPESDAPNKRLDFVIDPLRKRAELRKPETFDALKPLLVEAAQRDVLAAVLLLAEAMRERHLRESFSWYSYAAGRGRAEAYLQMGLILSNGIDGAREPEQALYYFKLAAENDDPDAKAALAECYLLGKGTAIDYQHGLRWLNEAVEQGSLRAMNRLATGYDNGIYGLSKNAEEAARLWTKVAETPDRGGQRKQPIGEANRNLALLHVAGRGTRRDEARAVALLKEGMRLGDADAMFILGSFQLEGIGGLPKDPTQGRALIKDAAKAGSRRAQDWCRSNGIELDAR